MSLRVGAKIQGWWGNRNTIIFPLLNPIGKPLIDNTTLDCQVHISNVLSTLSTGNMLPDRGEVVHPTRGTCSLTGERRSTLHGEHAP